MTVLRYLLDPPAPVFLGFLLLLLLLLWTKLKKDHFYLLVISTLLTFTVAEGILRHLEIGYKQYAIYKEDRVSEPKDNFVYKPNGKLVYRFPTNPRNYFDQNNEVLGNINSKGFRGKECEFTKHNNTTRIAILGDSFTLGLGVKDEHTLPVLFEKELHQDFPEVEVLNFGVSGYNTSKCLNLLTNYVLMFNPDIVIYVFFLNDADRIGTISFLSYPKILKRVRQYSYFLNALIASIDKSILHNRMIRHYHVGYSENSSAWKSIKSSLKKARSLSHKNNFQLLVAIYPVLIQLDERYPFTHIHQKIARFCEDETIDLVDLLNAFFGHEDSKMWVHPTDQHPNEVANMIAGRQLAKYIVERKLIIK